MLLRALITMKLVGVPIESFKALGAMLGGAKPRLGQRKKSPPMAVRPTAKRWERTALKAA